MNDKEELVGKRIGQYIVQSHIQEGGMADVYVAYDQGLDRHVALKLLFPEFNRDQAFVERFRREAKAVAKLRHANIVQVYSTGTTADNTNYIAMEYVDGGTLRDVIASLEQKGQVLTSVYALSLVRQVADALSTAHRAGIVHRDIKPSNILLRSDGTPVLTDLGIALSQHNPRITRTNAIMGTPDYMSPEQAQGETIDGRSDIYSLGILLYELLAGKRPFEGQNHWTIINQHINDEPKPITERRRGLSTAAAHVVHNCLYKQPGRRYQTAEQLVHALDQALAGEGVSGPVDTVGGLGDGADLNADPVVRRGSWIQRTTQTAWLNPRNPWLYGALLLLLLIPLGLFLALRGNAEGEGTAQAAGGEATRLVAQILTNTPEPTEASDVEEETTDDGETAVVATSTSAPTQTPTGTAEPTETPTATPEPTTTPTAEPTETLTPSNPTGSASNGGGLPLNFETFGTWVRGDQDNGTFTQSTSRFYDGASAARLSYDFDTSDNDFVVFLQLNSISGSPGELSVWVYGDGSGHFLNAWILDADGQTWQVPLGQVFHDGRWQQMSGDIDPDQDWPWTHISGPDNDEVDYPITFRAFVLDDFNNAYQGSGEIFLDGLSTGGAAPVSSGGSSQPTTPPTSGSGGDDSEPINEDEIGRILYTSGDTLLTTDPSWSSPEEVGTIASNSCGSPASTVTGQEFPLYFSPFCPVGESGTNVCASPNGAYEVLTKREEGNEYSIIVREAGSDGSLFIFQGPMDNSEGIRWSPISDSFLFVTGDTVNRGFLNGSFVQIISTAYRPNFSSNGGLILYLKPIGPGVNDVFVSNADGTNQRNVTNVAAIDKSCAAWRR